MNFTLNYSECTNWPETNEEFRVFCAHSYIDGNGKKVECPHGYYVTKDGEHVKFEEVTHHYDIEVEEDRITVNGKTMPVKYDRNFLFKLQKTQIKSNGLPRFLTDYGRHKDGDELTCHLWKGTYALICAHVVKHGK